MGYRGGFGFVAGLRLVGVKGRFLADERNPEAVPPPHVQEDILEVSERFGLSYLEEEPDAVIITLLEKVAWKMERTSFSRPELARLLDLVRRDEEEACVFPAKEDVAPFLELNERSKVSGCED